MNRLPLILLLSVIAALSVVIALSFGSISASPAAVWASLMGNGDPVLRDVLIQLRWPRAMAAFGTGAALAVAGVMMQVLLRNPLADPYILGTSGGAAVAALGAMTLGLTGLAVYSVAFAGALLSTLLVFTLANTGIDRSPGKLLLTGVVIAAAVAATMAAVAVVVLAAAQRRAVALAPRLPLLDFAPPRLGRVLGRRPGRLCERHPPREKRSPFF